MKKFIFLGIGVFLLMVIISCNKEKSASVASSSPIESSPSVCTNVVEEYIYKGQSYKLFFDGEDAETPSNPNIADDLEAQIQGKDISSVRYASDLHKIYLFDNVASYNSFMGIDAEKPNKIADENSTLSRGTLLTFFSDIDYNGDQLDGLSIAEISYQGVNKCSTRWRKSNLTDVGRGSGKNWNDVISSWKFRRQEIMTSSGDDIRFQVYRHSNYPTAPCKKEGWIVDIDNFDVPNLKCVYWCVWGGKLNDDITGFQVNLCKNSCSTCYTL